MIVDSLLIVEDLSEAMGLLKRVSCAAFPDARIGAAQTVRDARALIEKERWSMALIDIGLPDGSGLDLIRLIGAMAPETV